MNEIIRITVQNKLLAALVVFMASLSSAANASLIVDFNSTTGTNVVSSSRFTEDGFNFDIGFNSFILSGGGRNFTGFNSPVLEVDGLSTFVVSLASGELFDFNSVLAGQSGNNLLSFVGVFADNSTIISNVLAPEPRTQGAGVLSFGGFTSIRELRVTSDNSFALFDNFTFDTRDVVTQLPVPATLWLFVIGLIGLRFSIGARR